MSAPAAHPDRRSLGGAAIALHRDRAALCALVVLAVIAAACLAAPLWSQWVADTGPAEFHLGDKDTIEIDGEEVPIVSRPRSGLGVEPIGPGPHGRFLLGADQNGRDVMVRVLYGGRTTLLVSLTAAALTLIAGLGLGLLGGYRGGWVDALIGRTLDLIWAFPAVLLGIALGSALAFGGLKIGPLSIAAGSLWIPIGILSIALVPYVARPIRASVISLREREFIDAAVVIGKSPAQILRDEIAPHLYPTLTVLFAFLVASNILLESTLSFLGAGVRAPDATWGTMASEGVDSITSAPHLILVPSLAIAVVVFCLNVLADRLRMSLDPRIPSVRPGGRS